MAVAKGLKVVGYFDCPGGGQVVVRNNVAYVGHVKPPNGTSIIDVSDPAKPRELAQIKVPEGTLSHKVRVENGVMLVNREVFPIGRVDPDFKVALRFSTSATRQSRRASRPGPRAACTASRSTAATFTVRRSSTATSATSSRSSISRIRQSRRKSAAGGCRDNGPPAAKSRRWEGTAHRCHHPMRVGNRLYTSYWHGGFVILDIDDITKPKFVSGLDWSPPFPWPTHTALPVPFPLRGRRVMLVADEDVVRLPGPHVAGLPVAVDITDETRPIPFASFQVAEEDGSPKQDYTGLHQFCEDIRSTEIPIAWFAHGLRVVDIANPHAPKRSRLVHAGYPGAQSGCKATTCASTTGPDLPDRPHARAAYSRTGIELGP